MQPYSLPWPWDLQETLYVAAAIATIWLVMGGLINGPRRLWNATFGARQNQRRLINRLFPGATLQYVDTALGPPTLTTYTASADTVRRYRLPDCWVSVGEKNGAAEWISITITGPKFVLRTKRHTQGLIDVRLGRDCFDKAGIWFEPSADVIVGQKEQHYVEVCDGPTAHRSQKAVLGYTSLGSGNLVIQGDPTSATVLREETTINSLAIARPFGDLPEDVLLGSQEVQAVPLGRRRDEYEPRRGLVSYIVSPFIPPDPWR